MSYTTVTELYESGPSSFAFFDYSITNYFRFSNRPVLVDHLLHDHFRSWHVEEEFIVAKANSVESAMKEVKELKVLFDKIKKDSEEFYDRAKALSESGADEATALLDAVKSNWKKIVESISGTGSLAGLFAGMKNTASKKSRGKKKAAKKTSAKKAKK